MAAPPLLFSLLFTLILLPPPSISAIDFLINSFTANSSAVVNLLDDARVDSRTIRLTNNVNPNSRGRAFYQRPIPMRSSPNSSTITSFSTSFIFSILPDISSSPGFGLCFLLSNTTDQQGAIGGQYLGVFSNATVPTVAPLLAVEFDTGRNVEFNDPNDNHVGIDLNNIESATTETAGYFNSTGGFVEVNMRSGENIHVWIEFNGTEFELNVTIAPIGIHRPSTPLISYKDPAIANYVSADMFIGFSSSITTWIEPQRILAWSFNDNGIARDINTTDLPIFRLRRSTPLSRGAIAGIIIGSVLFFLVSLLICYWIWKKFIYEEKKEEIEDWELEYWPHRFSYEELFQATDGFSNNGLLGVGGFGKVYKGTLPTNGLEVAVKCVNHDSKQGMKEFMAEISSMGRLQHKNLVQMRGWCRKGNELMLVYDFMPNGCLSRWLFDNPQQVIGWEGRRRVLTDVAEGLNYLHHGWNQMVIHRDIKSSNILLDGETRGRLGDFGLAKLYTHGEVPTTTRVVGTLGYLAPELATAATPTAASDVYSFGVVILEVACGRRPVDVAVVREEDVVLIDIVRNKYSEGKIWEAADKRIKGEFRLEEMEGVLKLGLACCHPDPVRRPTMKKVVAVLLGEEVPRELNPGNFAGEDDSSEVASFL